LQSCTRREGRCSICDINNSLFGEDAFYRDATFYDCDEGSQQHDWLFRSMAVEQARLKARKAGMLAHYASFELQQAPCVSRSSAAGGGQRPPRTAGSAEGTSPSLLQAALQTQAWLGSTLPEWRAALEEQQRGALPGLEVGACWLKGDGKGFKVRCGPNHARNRSKTQSEGSMYEAISCDAIRANSKIDRVIGHLIKELPLAPDAASSLRESDCGGEHLHWSAGCPLPRVLCVNLMLPYETGLNPWSKDGGCSFVGFFHIKPETIKALQKEKEAPACIRLFRAFCKGPCGHLDGPACDPNRSLNQRLLKGVKKDLHAGLFKMMAQCTNPEDVNVPDMFHTYNGKPTVITKSGYIVKDPQGEWLEMGVDVRMFNLLARKMLCSFRQLLPKTKIHYGSLVQGIEDDEMPEGLICDMYVCGVNMIDDPMLLDNL